MRRAFISDIHANLEALDAVLEAIESEGARTITVLGDIVGYGADPASVLERLTGRDDVILLAGNHDLAACGRFDDTWFNSAARTAIRWTAEVIGPSSLDVLRSLEPTEMTDAGLCVHGSVVDPAAEYVVNVDDSLRSFEAAEFTTCFFGHTHLPSAFFMDAEGRADGAILPNDEVLRLEPHLRYMLNPGSVGQPRDSDPRASYMLVDDDAATAVVRRVDYDIPAAQAKIRAAGLPDMLAARLSVGR